MCSFRIFLFLHPGIIFKKEENLKTYSKKSLNFHEYQNSWCIQNFFFSMASIYKIFKSHILVIGWSFLHLHYLTYCLIASYLFRIRIILYSISICFIWKRLHHHICFSAHSTIYIFFFWLSQMIQNFYSGFHNNRNNNDNQIT